MSDEDFDKKLSEIRHSLKNPLNSILGYAEMLADDARDDGNTSLAEDLGTIASSARRAADLIDDLVNREQFVPGVRKVAVPTEGEATDTVPQDIDVTGLTVPEKIYNRLRSASDNHSITDMRTVLEALGAESPDFSELVNHLRALNQQYDMDAILQILDRIHHE